MNADFTNYVRERINNINVVSPVERHLVSAADKYDLEGRVKLLYINSSSLVIYEAEVNNEGEKKRVTIDRIGDEIPHSISEILGEDAEVTRQRNSLFGYDSGDGRRLFDEYFSQFLDLEKILSELSSLFRGLDFNSSDRVVVVENEYKGPVVEYVLQTMVKEAIFAYGLDDEASVENRIYLEKPLLAQPVGINFPMNNISGLVENRDYIYVPLHNATFSSSFYKGFTWKCILGDLGDVDDTVVEIGGCPCRLVQLTPSIDSYSNVFLTVYSPLDRRAHNVLIDGPGLQCN